MSNDTRTLPAVKWYIRLERVHDTEAALGAWRRLVIAQGWSPIGGAQVTGDGTGPLVIGEVVKYPGLTIKPGVSHVVVPA